MADAAEKRRELFLGKLLEGEDPKQFSGDVRVIRPEVLDEICEELELV